MAIQDMSLQIINNVAKPINGTGEIITKIGKSGLEISVTWEDNVIQKSEIIDKTKSTKEMTLRMSDPIMKEAVSCYKCWVDDQSGAWICLPTAC